MKKILITLSVLLNVVFIGVALYMPSLVSEFTDGFLQGNRDRLQTQFALFDASNTDRPVVFFGDSITEGGQWAELFPNTNVVNRGIGGDTTANMLARVEQVHALNPEQLFILAGINDLNRGVPGEETRANFLALFDGFDRALPNTTIFVQSVLPLNDDWPMADNSDIPALNDFLREQAASRGYRFVDLHSAFADENGHLKRHLSNDGIHLLGAGYALWRDEIQHLVSQNNTAR